VAPARSTSLIALGRRNRMVLAIVFAQGCRHRAMK